MAGRHERRAQVKEAARAVAGEGLSPRLGVWALIGAARLLLDDLETRSPQRATRAAARMIDLYERSVARIANPEPLACRAGCHFCCHSFVAASAPELLFLAREIRDKAGAELGEIIAGLRAAHAATEGLDKEARSRLRPCALLAGGMCSFYAARPLACRAFASFSYDKCAAAFESGSADIPVPGHNMQLRGACNQALWSALGQAKLPHLAYELTHGLLVALTTEDAERRWLNGEDVFAAVQPDEMALSGAKDPQVQLYFAVIGAAAAGKEPPRNPWLS